VFRSIVISPDQELGNRLVAALQTTGQTVIAKQLERYPTAVDLVRSLRTHAAEVVFVSFGSLEKGLETVKLLEEEAKNVPIVGFHRELDPKVLRETMRVGVREFLVYPFERAALNESLTHVKSLLERDPVIYGNTGEIFSFLPSKAGAGTSTIAANVSAAMARKPDTKVLLADFDLNSGMLRFMLKLSNSYSVPDAMEHAFNMDENLWRPLVTEVEGMDVLHAGRVNPNYRIEPAQIQELVVFLRRHYDVLCFDLSGNLEKYSLELMQESKKVLLVCTPEVPSLHLAREKMQFLKQLDLSGRVSIVLNRASSKMLFSKAQVEEIVGHPVVHVFPNDYNGVNKAVTAGTLVAPNSEVGKTCATFADSLIGQSQGRSGNRRKFLEFFSSPSVAVSK
jgi:pilus assembly protein CpaE